MQKIILISLILLSFACHEESEAPCYQGDDALGELPWLTAETEANRTWEYAYITKARYKGHVVFLSRNCCIACSSFVPVRNCSGELVGELGSEIEPSLITDEVIIWKSDNNSCLFM